MSATAGPSLRNRLLVLAALVVILSLGLLGYALDQAFVRSAEARLQDRLNSYIYLMLTAIDVERDGEITVSGALTDPRITQPDSGLYLVVDSPTERWTSPSTLMMDVPDLPPQLPGRQQFVNLLDGGGEMPALRAQDMAFVLQYGVAWEFANGQVQPLTISVLEDDAVLTDEISAFRASLWRWLGVAALILVLMQLIFLRISLRPLRQIASDVAAIEAGEQRGLTGRYPRELTPLTGNLNRLLETEHANQKRYRNALDSLAHGLKTPLAVLRASLHGRGEEPGVRKALDEMEAQISRQLERAAVTTRRALGKPVPVLPEVRRLIQSLDKVYGAEVVTTELSIPAATRFAGERRDLLELLGNLLDNAYKYGNGRVRISARNLPASGNRPGIEFRVEDNGPGLGVEYPRLVSATADGPSIPDHPLFARGVRGDEQSDGHGLGLAIVSELVASYNGSIRVESGALGGALFVVRLPPS